MIKIFPCEELAAKFFDMCLEYQAFNEKNYSTITNIEKAIARVRREIDFAEGKVPNDSVLNIVFWFMDDDQCRILGTGRIRPSLNERFSRIGGHIAYDVRPTERGKNIATAILTELLLEARFRGLESVLVTCEATNIASIHVIEKNNGVFEKSVFDDNKTECRRYWIDCPMQKK